ncbi:Chitinase [Ascochyta lentis]
MAKASTKFAIINGGLLTKALVARLCISMRKYKVPIVRTDGRADTDWMTAAHWLFKDLLDPRDALGAKLMSFHWALCTRSLDHQQWMRAGWFPCKIYRRDVYHIASPEPPITCKFDRLDSGRQTARIDGSHFLEAYDFDSQTLGSEFWATFTYVVAKPIGGPLVITLTVLNHVFCVMPDDP